MASVLLTYSSFYVADSSTDHLGQYVGSVAVFIVVTTLKDSYYFFPDGTPMVTYMLYVATLYTDKAGNTKYVDMLFRVVGQLSGWALVFGLLIMKQETQQKTATPDPTNSPDPLDSHSKEVYLHALNEGLSTMIECVAITFATIPLVSPYTTQEKDEQPDKEKETNNIQSKEESLPPRTDQLILAAVSLAAIHYTLERTFHATMNPMVSGIQYHLQNKKGMPILYMTIFFQLIGVLLAAAYVNFCRPTSKTIQNLRAK